MKRLQKLQARMKEAQKRAGELRAIDTEKMTDEEAKELRDLIASMETIKADIDTETRAQALDGVLDDPAGNGDPANRSTIQVPDQPIYKGSHASMLGQQLLDIRATSPGSQSTPDEIKESRSRLEQAEKRWHATIEKQQRKENRAAATGGFTQAIGSDGGFFLQGETVVDLMTAGFNNSAVLSLCEKRTLNEGTQFVEIIGIDETSRADGSRSGGVRVYTTAELGALTASKTAFKMIRLEPKKLTGHYVASNEVLSNVTLLGQEMRQLFGEEFAFKAQDQVIRGTGSGEALGVLNAPCLIEQAKETGQAADTIVVDNILNMESKLYAEGPRVAYLVNRECKPQLSKLSVEIGTGGQLVPLLQTQWYQGNRMQTLNGFPMWTIEQCSALGDKGDIVLFDGSQYMTANKGDINEAMSIHVYFLYDQSAFRFVYFFDGQPRWASSVTPYKGSSGAKVGPFVTLAARA